ncbi:hypothetical protein PaG_02991 [Moesziomyces aphidis]|uniref:Uncharacterized protein n=1 Tax=Moesziomyces aphidis TaxID=84754 RepID=W3VNG2_MOEAP|nr:hypothetical protein PaG_02991 [Moesziomyces aphidis]
MGGHAVPSTKRAGASTPTLSHKTSVVSATDTFASATDGEGYYTDARADLSAYHMDDARSRTSIAAHTIHAHDNNTVLSRSSSNNPAQVEKPIPQERTISSHQPPDVTAGQDTQSTSPTTTTAAGSALPTHRESDKALDLAPAAGTLHRIMRHLAVLGLMAFASIWGTLAREGLVALNTYDGQGVAPLVWAQAVGCLVMGLAVGANRKPIEGRYPPAYVMITTGFCGSVTAFSSWILAVFRAFGNQMHYDRHGLHNVMDALTQTGVTLGMAIAATAAGIALSSVLNVERVFSLARRGAPSGKAVSTGRTLGMDAAAAVLGLVFWIGAAVLCALYAPFRNVTFSLVLAPPGAVLRWYLSRLNTHALAKRTALPLGTLAANLLATAVIAAAFTASRVGSTPSSFSGGRTACQALQGLEDGFCGCLSTISTFAVELRTLSPRRAVRYAVVSWVAGVLICVLLIGAPWWAIGMDGRCVGLTY